MAKEKILSVEDVSFSFEKNGSSINIKSSGNVTSSGWENPRLVPRSFEKPPPDGIYDFNFVAEIPSGIDLSVVTPIEAELKLEQIPNNLKSIRIHAKNSKVFC